jgi:hypothetical protein
METTDKQTTHQLFHQLWTKAVGEPGYNKSEWMELSKRIVFDPKPKVISYRDMNIRTLFQHVWDEVEFYESTLNYLGGDYSIEPQMEELERKLIELCGAEKWYKMPVLKIEATWRDNDGKT